MKYFRLSILAAVAAFNTPGVSASQCVGQQSAPYPCSQHITGMKVDWSSLERHGRGSDNWPLTWADDDAQYTNWGDGFGWNRFRGEIGQRSFGVSRLQGPPARTEGHDIYEGAFKGCDRTVVEPGDQLCGKSYGIVALDSNEDGADELYMWLSPGSGEDNLRSAELFYSRDYGRNWGYGGVGFGRGDGLALPTFIQFGQSHSAINDAGLAPDYAYMYAIGKTRLSAVQHGLGVFKPGLIYLLRAPVTELGHKTAYEYFTGDPQQPWSRNASRKAPVFVDPGGVGWNVSAMYSPKLGRYLLMTEHWISFRGNLGLFESENPWGPWRTVAYFSHWGKTLHAPKGADADTAFFWNFSPKWMAQSPSDEFSLVYTGIGKNSDSFNVIRGRFELSGVEGN